MNYITTNISLRIFSKKMKEKKKIAFMKRIFAIVVRLIRATAGINW